MIASEYANAALSLGLVFLVMVIILFIFKKLRMSGYNKNKHINILNMVPIGGKGKIILMEVNNSVLLVGATPDHIETLHVFKDEGANVFMDEKK